MIATDVVEVIGELAEEMRDWDVSDILVRLGVAPDEIDRMVMVALWCAERVEKSLSQDDELKPKHRLAAGWLDGFAIGLAAARRSV